MQVIANALLPGAKGQSMGFGWIGLGYGIAFMIPGVMFGGISANLNPALCLADLVLGDTNFQEFLALSAAEVHAQGGWKEGGAQWKLLGNFKIWYGLAIPCSASVLSSWRWNRLSLPFA